MRSPTIRDVARKAGVGVGTVSRVLNGSTQVREVTRQKVLAAIKELSFSPNAAARQLSGGKTFTIGVMTPFFTYPSFVERLTGVQDALHESDYDLVLYSIRSPEQLERQMHTLLTRNRVDGLIVLSLPVAEEDIRRANPNLPIIVIDDTKPIKHYPRITIDNVAGGEMATNYLIERGHRMLGFVGDQIENTFGFVSTRHRYEGFCRALNQAGLPLVDNWVRFGEHSQEAARQNALEILKHDRRPTAIFVSIDTLALGVLAAISDLNLRVPEDVAVIGFDDIQAASYMNLTTVQQHLVYSGQLGAQWMLNWLDRKRRPEPAEVILPLEIVDRSTV